MWTCIVWMFRRDLGTAALVGLGLTQIGEFSFVLVQVARNAGHVGADVYNATLATSLITILLNAFLVRVVPTWLGSWWTDRPMATPAAPSDAPAQHVVLCGFGRVGSAIGEALQTFAIPFVVIERDPDIVKSLHARGVPALFGDAAGRATLEVAAR